MNAQSREVQAILPSTAQVEQQNRRLKQIAVGGFLVLAICGLWVVLAVGRQAPVTSNQNTALGPAYYPCTYVGMTFTKGVRSTDFVNIDDRIAEEKKLPSRFTFLVGDESIADGLMALISFADKGISDDGFAINLLGSQLHAECQAGIADENAIITLRSQVIDLQQQLSVLQKASHPNPAQKANPKPF